MANLKNNLIGKDIVNESYLGSRLIRRIGYVKEVAKGVVLSSENVEWEGFEKNYLFTNQKLNEKQENYLKDEFSVYVVTLDCVKDGYIILSGVSNLFNVDKLYEYCKKRLLA